MKIEDVNLITQIGKALYASPEKAKSRAFETVAAMATLDRLTDEECFEKITKLLLSRAEQDGTNATAVGISNPFFRLSPLERMVLAFLHSGKISYQKLSRLMGLEIDDLQKVAWRARSKVASSPEIRATAPHPNGGSTLKHSCPEYNSDRPWTQKLLDDEMGSSELTFVQNHTMACASCLRSLKQAREFYYSVEKCIPGVGGISENEARAGEDLLDQARRQLGRVDPQMTQSQVLTRFFLRTDVLWLLGGLGLFLIVYFIKH